MLAESEKIDKKIEDHLVNVESIITVHYDLDECSTLPNEAPGNENRVWKFGCNKKGQAWYSYYENSLCNGKEIVKEQILGDNTLSFDQVDDKEGGNNEIIEHIGDIVFTCDEDTKNALTGEYIKVIAKETIYPKRLPCDKMHILGDALHEQLQKQCDKYDHPKATFASFWECTKCIGTKMSNVEDRFGKTWEIHDMHGCILTTTYTQQYVNMLRPHVLRDGGDAVCMHLQEDGKTGTEMRKAHVMDKDGNMKTATEIDVGLESLRPKQESEHFHNHPKRDQITERMENDFGMTYNEETRQFEVATGHTSESVRQRLRASGVPVVERESEVRRRERKSKVEEDKVGFSESFSKFMMKRNFEKGGGVGGDYDYYGSNDQCHSRNLKARMGDSGDMKRKLDEVADKLTNVGRLLVCSLTRIAQNFCGKRCFIVCVDVCGLVRHVTKETCTEVKLDLNFVQNTMKSFTDLMKGFVDNDMSRTCSAPHVQNPAHTGSKSKMKRSKGRRKLSFDADFARDVMQEEQVGSSDACKDFRSKDDTGCGKLWFYPGWEGGIAFTIMTINFSFGIGYAGSQDGVAFSYQSGMMGNEVEALAMDVYALMNIWVKKFNDFMGKGEEICAGATFPGIEAGFSMCWGWAFGHGTKCCNSFALGVSAGFGAMPVEFAWGEPEVFCIDAGCL